MEDVEKIEHREMERQGLITKLKDLAWQYVAADDIQANRLNESYFYWGLIASAVACVHNLELDLEKQIGNDFYLSALSLFRNSILPRIEAFTPVREERQFLATEFLAFVFAQISFPIHSEMVRLSVPPWRDEFLKRIS